MRRGIRYAAVVVLALWAATALAAPIQLGSVDLKMIFEKSKMGRELQKKRDDKLRQTQVKIREKQQDAEKFRSDMLKQRSVLSNEASRQKEREYNDMVKDLKRYVQDEEQALNTWATDKRREFHQVVRKNIIEYAKKNNYTMVYETSSSGIFYSSPDVDITKKIISVLDAGYIP